MKICILQPYLAPYRVKLFDNIGRLNNGETIICYYSRYEKRRKWIEKFKLVHCKEESFKGFAFQIGYSKNIDLPNVFRMILYIKKEKPDIIVCFPNTIGLIIMILSIFFKFKIISWMEITILTEASRGFIKSKLRNFFFSKCISFIIPGIETKIFLKNLGFPKINQKLYFAPNSVDSEFQITHNELNNKLETLNEIVNFYFSGNLIRGKGIDILLEAFKIVYSEYHGKRNYRLNILGAGNYENEQINNVIFHGFQTGDNYLNVIKKSHVFILPSRSDCNPLTVIEALKNGCILILSKNVGNASDYIQDNGYVLESLTALDLSQQVISLLECPLEQLKQMSNISHAIGKNITHENSAKGFFSAIR